MSSIDFHSRHGTAKLRGSERAYASMICSDMLADVLELRPGSFGGSRDQHWLTPWLNPRFAGTYGNRQIEMIRLALSFGWSGDSDITLPDGRDISPFSLGLNTAYRAGADPIRLLARLHGQCELHCWVDGPNRAWLAKIIRDGARDRIMRRDQGWDGVVDLLESADDGPVVCSYSVCEGFPNSWLAEDGGWVPTDEDEDRESWYDLHEDQAWDFAMRGLRELGGGLEMRPDNWDLFTFGAGVSAWDLQDMRPSE